MSVAIRRASLADVPVLERLIPASVRALQAPYYTSEQMEGALGTVFGVDRQLINDGTYLIAEAGHEVVGCGGWSKRKTLFGGDHAAVREDDLLDPRCEAARIRAFFVHPDWARRGIGSAIMEACEAAAVAAGFTQLELVATLAGEPLYRVHGFAAVERYDVPLPNGASLPVVRMTKPASPR